MDQNFFSLEPESPGDWAGHTRFVNYDEILAGKAYRRKLEDIEVVFDFMPNDDLIICGECYLASDRLKDGIQSAKLTGAHFEKIDLSISEIFEGYYPEIETPKNYSLLVPQGEMRFANVHIPTSWTGHDFCLPFYPDLDLSKEGPLDIIHYMIVTEEAYQVIKSFKFENWNSVKRILNVAPL